MYLPLVGKWVDLGVGLWCPVLGKSIGTHEHISRYVPSFSQLVPKCHKSL